jgi:hypothetical protein
MRRPACLFLFTSMHLCVCCQQVAYYGKITKQTGQPVPFPTVRIKDTKTTFATNAVGLFSVLPAKGSVVKRELKVLSELITKAFGIKFGQATSFLNSVSWSF